MPIRLMNTKYLSLLLQAMLFAALAGCAVNPVTGEKEFQLLDREAEIRMGEQNYAPAQQGQGGAYVVDAAVVGYVQEVGRSLAARSDRPDLPYEFVVLNNSVPNAWAMPGGKIAVNRGLLVELENEAELAAVLAHEIVHAAARHGAKGVERGMLLQAGTAGIGLAVSGRNQADLLVGAAAVGATLINQKYTRNQEQEADYYGMHYMARVGYEPAAAISLQEKFVRLSQQGHSNWLDGLFASHPPSEERVALNRKTRTELPAGGKLGREEYLRRLAVLFKDKPAYDAYEEGVKALAQKGQDKKARELAAKALAIEPREGLFHGLRAEALFKEGKSAEALSEYEDAIRLNNSYYAFYLRRGQIRRSLGMTAVAEQDLAQSLKLLPTANAHLALGELALKDGRRSMAVEHLSAAASSESTLGQQAGTLLARLELPEQPGRYIRIGQLTRRDSRLYVDVENHAPLAVKNLQIALSLLDNQGRVLEETVIVVAGPIPAGRAQTVEVPVKGSRLTGAGLEARGRVLSAAVSEK